VVAAAGVAAVGGKTAAGPAGNSDICGTTDSDVIGGKTGATDTIGARASEANLLYLGSPNSLRDTEGQGL